MNSSVTVSVKGLLVTGLVVLGLVVAYLLGAGGGSSAVAASTSPATAATPAAARTVAMSGTGTATVVPDELTFGVSVSFTRPLLAGSLGAANRTMRRVLGSLTPYGVAKGDTRSTGLSMDPVYDYPRDSPPVLRGYRVSEQDTVVVKDLRKGGTAVSAVVAAGGNAVRVSDISLGVADPDAGLAKARADAIAQATAKAKEYAAASGQHLAQVLTIREVAPETPQPVYDDAARAGLDSLAAALPTALPLRGGHGELQATVQVIWDLAD